MIFLSFPYSHPEITIIRNRISLAEKIAASMIKSGLPVISPVLHWYNLLNRFDIPSNYEFWKNYCYDMLAMSDILFVLKMKGWETSTGVMGEIKDSKYLGLTIKYHDIRYGVLYDT